MSVRRSLRIGNISGFYGDRLSAAREMPESGPPSTGVRYQRQQSHPVLGWYTWSACYRRECDLLTVAPRLFSLPSAAVL